MTTQNGIKGYKVTSKTNGNSIFLPAGGRRCQTLLEGAGSLGFYWSSTPDNEDFYCDYAYRLYFISDFHYIVSDYRYDGYSVRPVLE